MIRTRQFSGSLLDLYVDINLIYVTSCVLAFAKSRLCSVQDRISCVSEGVTGFPKGVSLQAKIEVAHSQGANDTSSRRGNN